MKTKLQLLAVLALATLTVVLAQGPLTPPGAPAPVMKTLDQIEPRTPVDSAHTPGSAGFHYTISQPGCVYLTGNLAVTQSGGVEVNAPGVTLDLNGFEIRRTSGSGGDGVVLRSSASSCIVRNGSVRGFFLGVSAHSSTTSGSFLDLSVSNCANIGIYGQADWLIDGCRALNNAVDGIFTTKGGIISNCTARDNGGFGIAAVGATITNCVAISNSLGGISGQGATLHNCAAFDNEGGFALSGHILRQCYAADNLGGGAIRGYDGGTIDGCAAVTNRGAFGIALTNGSITNCTALRNGIGNSDSVSYGIWAIQCTVTGCTSSDNTSSIASNLAGTGILAANGSTVKDCTVTGNRGDGIRVNDNCHVTGNTCESNGGGTTVSLADGSNIRMTGSANRIENNLVTNADIGIAADANRNFIARNTARLNTQNYIIVAGNRIAQIVVPAANAAAINGANSGSTDGFTAVDPWANFSF